MRNYVTVVEDTTPPSADRRTARDRAATASAAAVRAASRSGSALLWAEPAPSTPPATAESTELAHETASVPQQRDGVDAPTPEGVR